MPSKLKKVSKLTITFLVDNNIEWMTKLPPGFSHEILHHIRHSPLDEEKGCPVLDFNQLCCGAHGFAALLETELAGEQEMKNTAELEKPVPIHEVTKHLTLFDTGPDSLSLVRNIRGLQVPITEIEQVVTSHWHSDHTGGLLSFLELRNECLAKGVTTPEPNVPGSTTTTTGEGDTGFTNASACIVDVHPSRPLQRGIAPPPSFNVICALPLDPSFSQITALGPNVKLEKHRYGHTVAGDSVYISGEIPRVTEFEAGLLSGVRWVEEDGKGKWAAEPHLMDERYAVVDVEGKGLVVFSSCSHAGIVNVIKDAVKTFNRPIYMIVGGLHLASSDLYPRIEPTVNFLAESLRPSPTYILPMHCTGWRAKVALEQALGEGVVPAGVGHRVEINGIEGVDDEMWVEISEKT
ncbi:hypothetical protein FA15DRAFT_676591 [Coprinopsis marcescibilis]|uniref:Metallo-beta-lactamase domain-containing protein n=1 Tax=Coprinopsis marcescibilis TaxID=230819 RepID=A0A5C3K9H9_COPMA|nr:hypothetical protein FA15DRAFT_676591 [Coprinopsis marcescibilis]